MECLPYLLHSVSRSRKGRRRVREYTLNLRLDIVDGVGRFDLEGDGLTREGLDEDLHDGLQSQC